MMITASLGHLLSEKTVALKQDLVSKKRVLETVALMIAEADELLSAADVFFALLERERLGSTVIGHGIALPHARLSSATRPISAFLKLSEPITFDQTTRGRVDMIYAMIVPENITSYDETCLQLVVEHLKDLQFIKQLHHTRHPMQVVNLWQSRSGV